MRAHRGIGNGRHWILDVAFREAGAGCARVPRSRNLCLLRRMVFNLLRQDTTIEAGRNLAYMATVLDLA